MKGELGGAAIARIGIFFILSVHPSIKTKITYVETIFCVPK